VKLIIPAKLNRKKWREKLEVNHTFTLGIGPMLILTTERMKNIRVIDGVVTLKNDLIYGEIGEGLEG
jgi:hypothetical protein